MSEQTTNVHTSKVERVGKLASDFSARYGKQEYQETAFGVTYDLTQERASVTVTDSRKMQ